MSEPATRWLLVEPRPAPPHGPGGRVVWAECSSSSLAVAARERLLEERPDLRALVLVVGEPVAAPVAYQSPGVF